MSPPVDRSVLVTGCSSGLGRAVALRLRARDWRVFATARTPTDLAELGALGLEPVHLDLARSDTLRAAVDHVLERSGGRLGALVNNAGYTQFGAVEGLTRPELREQFEANVFGPVELTNLLLPTFRRQGAGRIAFMSSVCGRFSIPYFGGYCASKFALEAFADALRRETRGSGIAVQLVEPGLFATRGFETMRRRYAERPGADGSVHADLAARTLDAMARSLRGVPEGRAALVADAVEDFVEGRSGRARRMVPQSALVYELAHRFLPDGVQDLVVEWRGRRTRRRAAEGP